MSVSSVSDGYDEKLKNALRAFDAWGNDLGNVPVVFEFILIILLSTKALAQSRRLLVGRRPCGKADINGRIRPVILNPAY
jgi:hypothetical protein